MPSLNYFDKDKQEWVAIPLGGGTDADLSAYATTEYVDGKTDEIKAMSTMAFQERYTKQEVDAKVAALQQGVTDANLGVQSVADQSTFIAEQIGIQTAAKLDLKADKATTYTKAEVDEAIGDSISGQLTPEQITEIISQVGPVDLTAYAKISDNTQAILAKTVVTQAVGFGDAALPPVALTYTDTGEGFGPRLVFAVGMVNDYVALRSDFDPFATRIEALESKAAPTIDAYTKAQVDTKLTAINPTGAATINDPALAAFKKSVLDEVKLMLVGGTKMPPADIGWTPIIRMEGTKETTSTQIQARMLGGFIELKGTLTFSAGSSAWVPLRLPPQFPLPELEASYPLAMRLVGSAVTYGYCTVKTTNRDISVSPGAQSSEANFSGIRWKAAY